MSAPSLAVSAIHPIQPIRGDSERTTLGRAEAQLYGVYEISKLLSSAAPLEVSLQQLVQVLTSFVELRYGVIALWDAARVPELVVGTSAVAASARGYLEQFPERALESLSKGTPIVVPSARNDALWAEWAPAQQGLTGDLGVLAVPIREDSSVIGMLALDRDVRRDGRAGLQQELPFLSMLASMIGQTVRVKRLSARDRERQLEERRRLEREVEQAAPAPRDDIFGAIVGDSQPLRAVIDKVRVVARSNSTVLLRGESGTGKELFARAIHDLSPRRGQSFVKLNCAALPESVLESELFGHEKGAFTGAVALRKGRFELAHGGTLFLDEIGEISPSFQAKLLRVLQEGEFERVGGSKTIKVDVRLVAATHRNLEEAVACGEFRADLYYRIGVIPIALPALRERATDIPLLAREFLRRFNAEHGRELEFADEGLEVLSACLFPGNVRELENCVRRTATLATGRMIRAEDFACRKHECLSAALWQHPAPSAFVPLPLGRGPRSPAVATVVSDRLASPPAPASEVRESGAADERDQLLQAMESAGWVQAKAARLLGLTPRQVGYALRKYEIAIKRF